MKIEILYLATLVSIAACGRDATPRVDSSAALARPESTAAVRPAAPPASESSAAQPVGVSEDGVGPIRIGMPLGEVRHATANTLVAPPAADTATCGYALWPRGLPGLRFMTAHGKIVRVDVDSGRTATSEGARIADSEARIAELYAGHVETTPAKYAGGHYLKVRKAGADSGYRLIFETDGKHVTRYRAGRMPELGYVEGCG